MHDLILAHTSKKKNHDIIWPNNKKTEEESTFVSPLVVIPPRPTTPAFTEPNHIIDAGKEIVEDEIMTLERENNKLPPGNWALEEVAGMLSDLNADRFRVFRRGEKYAHTITILNQKNARLNY